MPARAASGAACLRHALRHAVPDRFDRRVSGRQLAADDDAVEIAAAPLLRPGGEVAIVQPAPIMGNMVHPYLRRRGHPREITHSSEAVRAVLKCTLGVSIFQEQAMQLAMVAAGLSRHETQQVYGAGSRVHPETGRTRHAGRRSLPRDRHRQGNVLRLEEEARTLGTNRTGECARSPALWLRRKYAMTAFCSTRVFACVKCKFENR